MYVLKWLTLEKCLHYYTKSSSKVEFILLAVQRSLGSKGGSMNGDEYTE